jgi:two-component system nitrate/nitrite response regulator NarL
VTQHDRDKPQRALKAVLAVVVPSPLEVATGLGEERWGLAHQKLSGYLSANASPSAYHSGPGLYVCSFHDADSAVEAALALMGHGQALGIPLQAAVHAGEVIVDERACSGIAALTALQVAGLAGPDEVLLTQPAMSMCRSMPAGFVPGGQWQPPGYAVATLLYRNTSDGHTPAPPARPSPGGLAVAPILSQREQEVVLFVARGHSNREIASALDIALGTVERHVANILKKLQFRSRTQIARWAVDQGMIEAPETAR